MYIQNSIAQEIVERSNHLKYLKFEMINSNTYVAFLNDAAGDTIVKGYGSSVIDAINDLHHNLI